MNQYFTFLTHIPLMKKLTFALLLIPFHSSLFFRVSMPCWSLPKYSVIDFWSLEELGIKMGDLLDCDWLVLFLASQGSSCTHGQGIKVARRGVPVARGKRWLGGECQWPVMWQVAQGGSYPILNNTLTFTPWCVFTLLRDNSEETLSKVLHTLGG